jgi:hypothetical protein
MPSNFQFSADNGYSTDQNTTYLEEKGLDGYISTRKLSRKEKKYNLWENHFKRIISTTMQKSEHISAFRRNFISTKNIRIQKQTKNKLLDK